MAAGEGAPGGGFLAACFIEICTDSLFAFVFGGTTSGMKHLPGAFGSIVTLQARSFFAMISSSFRSMSISTGSAIVSRGALAPATHPPSQPAAATALLLLTVRRKRKSPACFLWHWHRDMTIHRHSSRCKYNIHLFRLSRQETCCITTRKNADA